MNKDYLGDSVYVENENDSVKLTTDNGMGRTSNTIILESETLGALLRWCERHGWIKPR